MERLPFEIWKNMLLMIPDLQVLDKFNLATKNIQVSVLSEIVLDYLKETFFHAHSEEEKKVKIRIGPNCIGIISQGTIFILGECGHLSGFFHILDFIHNSVDSSIEERMDAAFEYLFEDLHFGPSHLYVLYKKKGIPISFLAAFPYYIDEQHAYTVMNREIFENTSVLQDFWRTNLGLILDRHVQFFYTHPSLNFLLYMKNYNYYLKDFLSKDAPINISSVHFTNYYSHFWDAYISYDLNFEEQVKGWTDEQGMYPYVSNVQENHFVVQTSPNEQVQVTFRGETNVEYQMKSLNTVTKVNYSFFDNFDLSLFFYNDVQQQNYPEKATLYRRKDNDYFPVSNKVLLDTQEIHPVYAIHFNPVQVKGLAWYAAYLEEESEERLSLMSIGRRNGQDFGSDVKNKVATFESTPMAIFALELRILVIESNNTISQYNPYPESHSKRDKIIYLRRPREHDEEHDPNERQSKSHKTDKH